MGRSSDDSPGHGRSVEAKLRKAWRKRRHYHHTSGLCHLVVWAVPLILVSFALDWLLEIPPWGRVLLLAINVVALGWVVWHYWLRHLERYDRTTVALQVEDRHPDLENLLISYVQIAHGEEQDPYTSGQLVGAMRRCAIEATTPLDFRDFINYRELKRIFVFTVCLAAFFSAISLTRSRHFGAFVMRMLNPVGDVEYPRRTRVTPITTNLTVQQGKAVVLAAKASGFVPASGLLRLRSDDGDWREVEVARRSGDRFIHVFEEVHRSFDYYFRIEDDRTEVFHVEVVPRPRITKAVVSLTYPPYTGLGRKQVETLNLRVPESTRVKWRLRVSPAVSVAELVRLGPEPRAMTMKLGDGGAEATCELDAAEPLAYRFRWKEKRHGYVYEDPVQHFLQIKRDHPPDVEILHPVSAETATIYKTVNIKFHASDDYPPLAGARIAYWLNDRPEDLKHLPLPEYKGEAITTFTWPLRNKIPKLKEGDTLHYAIEVTDRYDGAGGPHVKRSKPRNVSLLSLADYEKYIQAKRAALMDEVRQIYVVETTASHEIKEMRDAETLGPVEASTSQPLTGPAPLKGKPATLPAAKGDHKP